MEKRNNYDFSQPTRQSYAAILIITYRLYRLLFKQFFYLIILFFVQGTFTKTSSFLKVFIALAIVGAIYSIVSFFRYYFYVEKDKLIVRKGVFKKSTIEIPFDRIQTINTEQTIIHRIFNVVKLNLDTAGSSADEMQLYALDHKMAAALSQLILSKRNTLNVVSENDIGPIQDQKKVIFKLSIGQLLKVGMTANHLRSGAVIVFFIFWLYDSFRELGSDFMEYIEPYMPMAKQIAQSLVLVLFLILLFALVSFIISLIRTILNYFNLHMYRSGKGFVIEKGLFNKKEQAAKDSKIQIIRSSQNLLQSLTGIYELNIRQASSSEAKSAKSFNAVGLAKEDIDHANRFIFEDKLDQLENANFQKVDVYYLIRRLSYWSMACVPSAALLFYADQLDFMGYVIMLWIFGLLRSYLSYTKKRFVITKDLLMVKGGIFGTKSTLLLNRKVQNTRLYTTPFQRRRNLASIAIYTASGTVTIPDVKKSLISGIQNYLLYKVEKSGEHWM